MSTQRKVTRESIRTYKRRSQAYKRLRSKKLASGRYLVQHEPSKTEFYIFKRPQHEDWVITDANDRILRSVRKKDHAMDLLAEKGPRAVL